MPPKLDRLEPPDWQHVEKYPLRAAPTPITKPTPVVMGTFWYPDMDEPQPGSRPGEYWVGRDVSKLVTPRGGHCYGLLPAATKDPVSWWEFYNQGQEGACVGFGCSRMMSLLNRHRYDAFWLYHQAQVLGGYVGQEGAAVRDGLEVLRTTGPSRVIRGQDQPADPNEGIDAYRWATSVDEILATLGTPNFDYAIILNSWGRQGYPHYVKIPATTLEVLLQRSGEAGIVTDR